MSPKTTKWVPYRDVNVGDVLLARFYTLATYKTDSLDPQLAIVINIGPSALSEGYRAYHFSNGRMLTRNPSESVLRICKM
jgi:hypothetical protein